MQSAGPALKNVKASKWNGPPELVPGYTSGVVHTDILPNANGRDGAVGSNTAHEITPAADAVHKLLVELTVEAISTGQWNGATLTASDN